MQPYLDENGVVVYPPREKDFASGAEYARAWHEWRQRRTNLANKSFDEAFQRAMKEKFK